MAFINDHQVVLVYGRDVACVLGIQDPFHEPYDRRSHQMATLA